MTSEEDDLKRVYALANAFCDTLEAFFGEADALNPDDHAVAITAMSMLLSRVVAGRAETRKVIVKRIGVHLGQMIDDMRAVNHQGMH